MKRVLLLASQRFSSRPGYFEVDWLPFLNTYRTMCVAPEPDFRRLLEDIRELQIAA